MRTWSAAARSGRDVIQPFDLPVTKGLQERVHEFRLLDEGAERGARPHLQIIDPDLKDPQSAHWERSLRIFDQLL